MNYKKFLAIGLAASMAMGSSVVAFANEGAGTGSGTLDVVQNSDVFDVVLPTSSGTTFDYILDPTGVIKATSAQKYGGATFADNTTVFFANAPTSEGGATSYSGTSDAIKAENKSTMDVDITVTATIAAASGITMATNGTFAEDDTSAKLYLALKDDDTNNSDAAITADGAKLTSKIAALDDAYETKYEDGKYVKKLKSDATGFKTYSFQLTGACNAKGNWTGLTEAPPTVSVVWSIKDPTITGPQITLSSSGAISITGLTAEQNYSDLKIIVPNGTEYDINAQQNQWDTSKQEEEGIITGQLGTAWMDYLKGESGTTTVKLILTDGTEKTATATIS